MTPDKFVSHWQKSAGAELANSQSFLIELCELLDLPRPEPTQADEDLNVYTFEKAIKFNNGDGSTSDGRVDLYRRGCFVLESKQGSERKAAEQAAALATKTKLKKLRGGTAERGTANWEAAMVKARRQAEGYAKALPEWPPFLIVADVGHCFDLYADFSGTGKLYQPFPDPKNYRIRLADLADATATSGGRTKGDEVRETLRTIWLDPLSLDPTRRAAKVTRELAGRLAKLAKSLEEQTGKAGRKSHTPEDVAQFLMRCLFTMFAEDVELIPKGSFTALFESLRETPAGFARTVEALWRDMDTGCEFSPILRTQLKRFNGGLFEAQAALPLNVDQLELLIEASKAQWRDVEPAIFGTLLERALDPHERHKLGAHYTPRAYVERLVMPTIIEPLREQWDETYAAATALRNEDDSPAAIKLIREFHARLCETRVLDPACGSGNFLYVALELMKRLEGEVLNALIEFGDKQLPLLTIDPHQFLGIEVNPRAAAITDLVLWIGYLQWHFRTRGNAPLNEPIIRKFHNIDCRDAVLAWDRVEPVTDESGNPVTRWDGRTTKPHPVTGEEVPDETARVQELRYVNPRKAAWPKADYIVSNPPFLGNKRMRPALGSGYVDALRDSHSELPDSIDYVMYWWFVAAEKVSGGEARRFGLITTNSITQTYSRQVVAGWVDEGHLALAYAIPDHPWVDASLGAAVRIAMTVAATEVDSPVLAIVIDEAETDSDTPHVELRSRTGRISAKLAIGADVTDVVPLRANERICWQGCKLVGKHFQVEPDTVQKWTATDRSVTEFLKQYWAGSDVTRTHTPRFVIDFFGHSMEAAQTSAPALMQHLIDYVLPERQQNRDRMFRERWWIFGRPRPDLRTAMEGLDSYFVTSEVAKHRVFRRLSWPFQLVDGSVTAVALNDSLFLGLLSSHIHVIWALATGGRMGVGNDPRYQNGPCFDPFPFPIASDDIARQIRSAAEQLEAHRARQQELHPDLTMTGMYNVLEKLRSGEPLSPKERKIHDDGLVSVLKQIHDDLDAAVFDAYGWPHDLTDEQILERLVALNHERAEEESRGLIRWLRPEFQNPAGKSQQQFTPADQPDEPADDGDAGTDGEPTGKAAGRAAAKGAKPKKQPWPKTPRERVRPSAPPYPPHPGPATADDLAKQFTRAPKPAVAELLETLAEVGQARVTDDGRYVA